ncbi:MAG TPA: polyprenyl synthetase family protein [Gemmatales bacterium]|nr:polyprenyl synthetase family protein [Gemmatales bacterium]HMP59241.1 polyprenyl synthetase family protein [Gemmatales bacterium]
MMPQALIADQPMPAGAADRRAFDQWTAPVAADLAAAEEIFQAELASRVRHVQELVHHLAHYRGKQLRPTLLLLAARACGHVTREHHVLAAVVEMIHTATLVHDDILDGASLRRHVPTIHARWGNHSGVLLGDLLFTHAFYLASTTGSTLACKIIGEATNRVCEGELHQIGEAGNLDLSAAEYFDMISGKTAALTACATQLGAIFSGTTESVVESLTHFGHDLGMAFQIADDVLDLTGSEAEVGKSLGTDLGQRKLTLPLIHLLATGDEAQRQRLRAVLLAGPESLDELVRLLRDSGVLATTVATAERYAAQARNHLRAVGSSPSRDILERLTFEVIHRRS